MDASFCNLLVCSSSEELNKNKYELLHKFWEYGISADFFHEPLSSVYHALVIFKHFISITIILGILREK